MKFKIKPDFSKRLDNFSEYFDLAYDTSKKHKTYEFMRLFRSKSKSMKTATSLFLSTIGSIFHNI